MTCNGSGTAEAPDNGGRRRELAIAGGLLAFGVGVCLLALGIEPGVHTDPLGPRVFPVAMGLAIAACGLLLGIVALLPYRAARPAPLLAESGGDEAPEQSSPLRLTAALLATAAYIAAFEPVGYLLATPPYLAALIVLQGSARWRSVVVPPLLLSLTFYAAFRFGLLIPVPDGVLETWLPW